MKPDLRLVRTMPAQKPGKSKQDYETPRDFLDALELRWGRIDFDLAATDENTKGVRWFTLEDDALKQDWENLARSVDHAFLNPPFGLIAPWARKCAASRPLAISFLVPASVGSNWWAEYVHDHADQVLFLRPRLSFDGKNSFPKDCALVIYGRPGLRTSSGDTSYMLWDWRKV